MKGRIIFDGKPFILPVDAPPGVPRLILKNKNDSIKLEISLEKAVLIVQDDEENNLERSTDIIKKFNNIVFDKFGWEVNRLARITIMKFELNQSSIAFVRNKYVKEKKLSDIQQLNLHWLEKKII